MGGDLYEFTSTPVTQSSDTTTEGLDVYVMRGGSFHKSNAGELDSNYRTGADPAKYGHGRTFRIAAAFTTAQWSGLTTGGNWSTMTNWSGDAAPSAGIALQFGAVSKGGSVTNYNNITAGTAFNGITFTSAAPSYNLQGNAIDLAGLLQNASNNSQAVGLNIILVAGGGTLDSGTAGLTVSGTVSGATPLTKVGAGTLILSGMNAYSGGTTIGSGTLQLGNANALGTGGLTANAGVLDLAGFSPMVTSLGGLAGVVTNSGSADSLLTVNQSATTTFGGSLLDGATNKLALSLTGSGALVLSGTNAYSGGTTIGGGTLQLGNANALGTGGLTANAGVLDLAGFSPMVASLGGLAGVVTNSGSADSLLTVNQSATTTFGGSLLDGATNKLALSLTGSGAGSFRHKRVQRRHDDRRRHAATGQRQRPGHGRSDSQRRRARSGRLQPDGCKPRRFGRRGHQ